MGNEQEFEVVEVQVPKGVVKEGMELIVGHPRNGDLVRGAFHCPDGKSWLIFFRTTQLKPEWKPPKLKNGWVTWDHLGGWWWWPDKPELAEDYGWVDAKTGCGGDGQEICEVMAEAFGFPDCNGFSERHCIWKVGE